MQTTTVKKLPSGCQERNNQPDMGVGAPSERPPPEASRLVPRWRAEYPSQPADDARRLSAVDSDTGQLGLGAGGAAAETRIQHWAAGTRSRRRRRGSFDPY